MKQRNLGKGLIGIAASERNNFSWDFIQSLLELKHFTGAAVAYSQIGVLDIARNELVRMALKHDCDWLLMVDSDMTFPKDGVNRLMETMDKFGADVGGGLYFKGSHPYDPVAMEWDGENDTHRPLKDWNEAREVGAVGMGFTLIKKDAFGINFEFIKRSGRIWGEDTVFCFRARERGMKVILDPDVKCGHLRMIQVNEDYIKRLHLNEDKK